MERVQEALKRRLEAELPAALQAMGQAPGLPPLDLVPPRAYLLNFDEQFTVIGAAQYPCLILLPGRSRLEVVAGMGALVDYVHELAVICLIQDPNADALHRRRVRYAEAIVQVLLKAIHDLAPAIHVRILQVAYDRTLRDERAASYLTSVWVMLEARERVAY
ncbi:MAG: hypothetical protein N2507_03280 [Candidatus Bipolaricaulota bacterium]|nr:hypothetical protein [Candidatus Bipolaricaulota bacterium]